MIQNRTHQSEPTVAPEIEALLSVSNSLSIFDRLMAMPRAETDTSSEWDRVVASRLQAKVAGLMKARLEPSEGRRAA